MNDTQHETNRQTTLAAMPDRALIEHYILEGRRLRAACIRKMALGLWSGIGSGLSALTSIARRGRHGAEAG